jgi:hypothetical protein
MSFESLYPDISFVWLAGYFHTLVVFGGGTQKFIYFDF